jgi:hypothetical protein
MWYDNGNFCYRRGCGSRHEPTPVSSLYHFLQNPAYLNQCPLGTRRLLMNVSKSILDIDDCGGTTWEFLGKLHTRMKKSLPCSSC